MLNLPEIRSHFLKIYLAAAFVLTGMSLQADPWYCSGLITCNYYPITTKYLCQGESLEIFARNPAPNIIYKNPPCNNPASDRVSIAFHNPSVYLISAPGTILSS